MFLPASQTFPKDLTAHLSGKWDSLVLLRMICVAEPISGRAVLVLGKGPDSHLVLESLEEGSRY